MQLPLAKAPKPDGEKTKVAIFGGGIGGLTTAFEITEAPDWQDHFEVTIHQLGWRLGGKCATGRGPNDRIEEHGIHGFLGSYYNALPLMKRVYDACDRPAGQPLATFEEAFKPENFVLMWEFRDGNWVKWPLTMPENSIKPGDPGELQTIETIYRDISKLLVHLFSKQLGEVADHGSPLAHIFSSALEEAADSILGHLAEGLWDEILAVLDKLRAYLSSHITDALLENNTIRRLYISVDFLLALMRGAIADDVVSKGFDPLDDVNFDVWLEKHGAHPLSVSSPLSLNTPNLSYQYPHGDTSRQPLMAAGTYLHWTLRSFAYMGSFAYLFEAGTGETMILPMYEALKKRGVKFEFFNKVTDLRMSADGASIAEVDIDIQATLKDPSKAYQPLFDTHPTWLNGKALPAWPAHPNYDQLVEGDRLQADNINLESYWTPWTSVGQRTMKAGQDFDIAIYAIPVATINAIDPPGDPMSLDFSLLVCTENDDLVGVARFDEQFWRANIDPNERYTQSPPGSTACRIKAWETGYDNLVFAGDWAYTGLNVGSVEGTVMSGRLAAHAVTNYPPLDEIPGFLPGSL
ncbi:MAG: FAD-dependent oxidoreductase [Pseudomonadota bacterium]